MGLSWKEASEPTLKACVNYPAPGATHTVHQTTTPISETEEQGPNAARFGAGRGLLSTVIGTALHVRVG